MPSPTDDAEPVGSRPSMGTELRHELRMRIARHPRLFLPLVDLKPRLRPLRVRHDTELVIEGFPRSANTFSVLAFERLQSRPVRLAHHLHAPAQVIQAARWGVPVLLLLRNPRDALVSLLLRYPGARAGRCLREYVGFHRAVFPFREHCVVADFEQVTTDIGQVIGRVNRRFDRHFDAGDRAGDLVTQVFDDVERLHHELGESANQIARPTAAKEAGKDAVRACIEAPGYHSLLQCAEAWYARFRQLADMPAEATPAVTPGPARHA